MTKFKRWLRNWLNDENKEPAQLGIGRLVENPELSTEAPMRLMVHKASGGLVIETRVYDGVKERSHQRLHIVTPEQDLGQSISRIITMESLRG